MNEITYPNMPRHRHRHGSRPCPFQDRPGGCRNYLMCRYTHEECLDRRCRGQLDECYLVHPVSLCPFQEQCNFYVRDEQNPPRNGRVCKMRHVMSELYCPRLWFNLECWPGKEIPHPHAADGLPCQFKHTCPDEDEGRPCSAPSRCDFKHQSAEQEEGEVEEQKDVVAEGPANMDDGEDGVENDIAFEDMVMKGV